MTEAIDYSRLERITGGEKEIIAQLFELFFTQNEEGIKRLEEASKNQDQQSWKDILHELKGSAQNIGCSKLGNICLEAEKTEFGPEENQTIIESINKALEEIRAALN